MKNLPERNPQEDEDEESMKDEERLTLPLKKRQHHHHNPQEDEDQESMKDEQRLTLPLKKRQLHHQGSSSTETGDDDGVGVSVSCNKKAMQESQVAHKESPSSKKLKIGGTGSVLVKKKLAGDKGKASGEDDENGDQTHRRSGKRFTSSENAQYGEGFGRSGKLQGPRKHRDESKKATGKRPKLGESGSDIEYGVSYPLHDGNSNATVNVGGDCAKLAHKEIPSSKILKIGGTGTVSVQRKLAGDKKKASVEDDDNGDQRRVARGFSSKNIKIGGDPKCGDLVSHQLQNPRNPQTESSEGFTHIRKGKGGQNRLSGEIESGVVTESAGDTTKCKHCNKVFKNSQGLGGHMRVHNTIKGNTVHVCKICNKEFSSYQSLGGHISGKHGARTPRRQAIQEAAAPEVGAVSDHEDGKNYEDPEAARGEARGQRVINFDLNEIPDSSDLNELPDEDLDGDG